MMKKIILIAALVFSASAAYAQWFDFSNNNDRFEAGLCIGQVGSGTHYEGVGIGASVSAFGGQLDYLKYGPQHKYSNRVTDTDWNDTVALCINLGYQFPVLPWFRVTPLAGYAQTNEGITRGNEMYLDGSEYPDWYHPYDVTKGSRSHYFNYGGGVSVQPVKWFSISFAYTRMAIYGSIVLNLTAFADR